MKNAKQSYGKWQQSRGRQITALTTYKSLFKPSEILFGIPHLSFLNFLLVLFPFFLLDVISSFAVQVLLTELLEVRVVGIEGLLARVVEADGGSLLEGDLRVVVDAALLQPLLPDRNAGSPQLSTLLKRGQSTSLFQLLFSGFALGFLSLRT